MFWLLAAVCAVLILCNCILVLKVVSLHKAANEIRTAFGERLHEDTNVGIDVTSLDPKMRLLAADIDRQLRLLRRERLRYDQGNQELKDAVTNISHDLRTPLTAIYGYMELLKREDLPAEIQNYLFIIEGRLEVLKKLTEELFRYSLAASGEQYGEKKTVVINQVLENSLAACYSVFKEKGMYPDIKIPDKPVKRQLNEAALSRILENILGNVIKYSDGALKVELTEHGCMRFKNPAKNLDEVLVGRLFDRFYTVESGQNSTGLGLSIAKVLTEQQGGGISAYYRDGWLTMEVYFKENIF